ncbi:hypothetical protein BC939DRAFT_449006 [Gamsiella multidivaricata]|uniref:uncharacterized protein n=1 Tax=Gamsiella multidivaricata TaxID=101098 RepID=UPI00221F391B|nr:uncharacterized protein BC939DRAFT_449006 [Gamsiella multidivaricata]KAI7825199.1 hypothetical protein BC939DRAFT_449006 [Gamsiella multidivaricata]
MHLDVVVLFSSSAQSNLCLSFLRSLASPSFLISPHSSLLHSAIPFSHRLPCPLQKRLQRLSKTHSSLSHSPLPCLLSLCHFVSVSLSFSALYPSHCIGEHIRRVLTHPPSPFPPPSRMTAETLQDNRKPYPAHSEGIDPTLGSPSNCSGNHLCESATEQHHHHQDLSSCAVASNTTTATTTDTSAAAPVPISTAIAAKCPTTDLRPLKATATDHSFDTTALASSSSPASSRSSTLVFEELSSQRTPVSSTASTPFSTNSTSSFSFPTSLLDNVQLQDPTCNNSSISIITSTSVVSTAAPNTASATTPAPAESMDCAAAMSTNHILDLPTEILEEIICRLISPRNFVRSCRQIYRLSRSPSLRAKYLWLLHGPDQVLTRKVIELHRLTSSILSSPVVMLLMAMGAPFRDSEEFIFRWACSKGHMDVVSQLLKSEPRIDLRFRSDWFLREAAKNGRQNVVSLLLRQPDYVPSESGLNKAFEAAYEQSFCDTVRALLDYAENRGAQLEQGPSAFQSVVPSTRRAKRVMAGGLYIQKDADKALRYAVRGNDLEMVKLLMDYEADVHAFSEEAILVAAHKGHVEILKLLIQAGADIETKAGAPLRQAAEYGHAEAVKVLCSSGADTMWGGCSALRTAASQGFDNIIAILLEHGANVNIHEGTPLQLACKHGHEAAVRVLLKYGANHRLDDGAAYKLALEANHEGIKALLIQAETAMRAKERELDRILQQQGPMMMTGQQPWYSSHARAFSETLNNATFHPGTQTPAPSAAMSTSSSASNLSGMIPGSGSIFAGAGVGASTDGLSRGHKRFYSQMSNYPLSVADLFRSGSVCGLVALDDEIRSRQRSESNRL